MAARRTELRGLLLALGLGLTLPVMAQGSGRIIYCCDVGARQVCGDILPAVCYGRAYREVNPSGTIRRVVPAPLTPEEIAQRRAAERREQLEANIRLKQQRLDEALLETYRSLDDLDDRRDREVAALDVNIKRLRQRETELLERQNALIAESIKAGDDPGLEKQIRSLDSEIVAQRSVIAAKMRERAAILDRFDHDRERYVELTSPRRPEARPY